MKVFVSGCYDLLHSGHVEFFRQASQYGDLYVGIGSDATVLKYKNHQTLYPEQERLFMVKSIRYVKYMFQRRSNCSVVKNKAINRENVNAII